MLYFYLAVGGVVGTLARFILGDWIHSWAGIGFPWGTFTVNLLGSFLLGLAVRGADVAALSPELRGLLTIGFCGAFTTFSTLSYEIVWLLQAGEWMRASLYAFGSLALGIVAVGLGLTTATLLIGQGG